MQSRLGSLVESIANVAIGYGVAVGAQLLVFPLFALKVPLSSNLLIGAIFTAVSLARSYVLRRLFNYYHRSKHETDPR
jgi:hypothetical protein